MTLHCLGSESSGNLYLLKTSQEVLIIEAGIKLNVVKAVLDFDLSEVVGCLVTHRHLDHFKHAFDFAKSGINIYTSKETIEASGITGHRVHPIEAGHVFKLGMFQILPFDVPHGVKCHGFLIQHPDCGKLLFVTDAAYIKDKFIGLSHILIEANYDDPLLKNEHAIGKHMSIDSCIGFLKATDMKTVRNIILLHLSSGNSNAKQFRQSVQAVAPRAEVYIADLGLTIELKKEPF